MILLDVFAAPAPVLGFAVCRLLLGAALVVDAVARIRDRTLWYAGGALRPRGAAGGARALLALHAASASAFAVGLVTPVAGLVVGATLLLLHRRNPFVRYGGDALMLTMVILLVAAPSGRALSIDAWRSGAGLGLDAVGAPWGGRILQIEVAALYAGNALAKLRSPAWRDGSAVGLVLANRNLARAWVPAGAARASRVLTWTTLGVEAALAPALFLAPWPAIAAAIVLHVGLALFVDVHLFSAVMVAAVAAFLPGTEAAEAAVATAMPSGVGAGDWAAFLLAVAYLGIALGIWDRPVMASLRARLSAAGFSRDWRRLFAGPLSSDEVRVEVVVIRADGVAERCAWDPRVPLFHPPRRLSHRVERLKGALWRDAEAREVVGAHLRAALASGAQAVRAAAGAVLMVPSGASAGPFPAAPLFVSVRRQGGVLDREALAAALHALRARPIDAEALTSSEGRGS